MNPNDDNELLKILLHELCNPLTIATSLVEIMVNNKNVDKLPEVLKNLKRMNEIVVKLKQIKIEKTE